MDDLATLDASSKGGDMSSSVFSPHPVPQAASPSVTIPFSTSSTPTLFFSESIVVDTGAFIRLKQLQQYGRHIYTTPSVLSEIRDAAARKQLAFMADWIQVIQPNKEALHTVKAFAAQTGDLASLSFTDVEVIALTWMLQKKTGKVGHLRDTPQALETTAASLPFNWGPTPTINTPKHSGGEEVVDSFHEAVEACQVDFSATHVIPATDTGTNFTNLNEEMSFLSVATLSENEEAPHTVSDCDTSAALEASSEDEGEWVTADNLHRFGLEVEKDELMEVACMTTDFSLQNVLLQMGLNVLSFDGYRVKSVKLWGLICRACHYFERNSSRLFCERCGHSYMERVPFTVDSQGNRCIYDNHKKANLRGTIYSIPKVKNRRKQKQLLLAEDQLMMGGYDREVKHQLRLWETEKAAKDPFHEDSTINHKGWWHRKYLPSGKIEVLGAPKIVVGMGKGNPNSNRWMKKHKNKKNT